MTIFVIFFLDVFSPGSLNTGQAHKGETQVILYSCPTLVVVAGSSSSSPFPMHASSHRPSAEVEKGSSTLDTLLHILTYTQSLGWGLAGWLAGWLASWLVFTPTGKMVFSGGCLSTDEMVCAVN